MAEVSSQTLHIVARELASELNEARAALEAFGEQQENIALLRRCGEHRDFPAPRGKAGARGAPDLGRRRQLRRLDA